VKKGWTREWLKALLWILHNTGRMYRKRLKIQRNRKISDREIFKNIPLPFAPELSQSRIEDCAIKFLKIISATYWNYAKYFIH
jgi:hypothetical protein